MKYLSIILILITVSCSENYNSQEAKEAERLAVLIDMNVSDIFSDYRNVLEIWHGMPDDLRYSKNPAKNPMFFKIDLSNYKKNVNDLKSRMDKSLSGSVPGDLEYIVVELYDLYYRACNVLTDKKSTWLSVRNFLNTAENERFELTLKLTEIQKKISGK